MTDLGDMQRPGDACTPAGTARWLQLNVALVRGEAGALPSARALFARLAPLVAAYRRRRLLRLFLFVRKPPDVRLRFLGPDPERHLLPELRRAIDDLHGAGVVRRVFPSVYEPETRQFGGPEASGHVHAYFDADTAAWLALDRLAAEGGRAIPAVTLVAATMGDLFFRALGCRSEVWDTWCNLAAVIRAPEVRTGAPVPDIVLLDTLLPMATPPEKAVLRQYHRANQQLAAGLLRVWERGRLRSGLRAILPYVALFHLNRHGIDPNQQVVMVQSMVRAWDPKEGLIGASPTP